MLGIPYIHTPRCLFLEREKITLHQKKGVDKGGTHQTLVFPGKSTRFSGHWKELIDIELKWWIWMDWMHILVCTAVWMDILEAGQGRIRLRMIHIYIIHTYSKGEHDGVVTSNTGQTGPSSSAVQPPNAPVYLHWVVGRWPPEMGKSSSVSQCLIHDLKQRVYTSSTPYQCSVPSVAGNGGPGWSVLYHTWHNTIRTIHTYIHTASHCTAAIDPLSRSLTVCRSRSSISSHPL